MPRRKTRDHQWNGIQTPGGKHRNGRKYGEIHKTFPGPPCRTLADMSDTEIACIERTYGALVVRPIAGRMG